MTSFDTAADDEVASPDETFQRLARALQIEPGRAGVGAEHESVYDPPVGDWGEASERALAETPPLAQLEGTRSADLITYSASWVFVSTSFF